MSLAVTYHAIQRFMECWRVGQPIEEVETELRVLATQAMPTRRRTRPGDAWIYIAHTQAGERILFAVRDSVIVTVLPRDAEQDKRVEADIEMFEESEAERLAIRTMLDAEVREQAESHIRAVDEQNRKDNARECIARWKSGKAKVSRAALARAHRLLGLPFEDMNSLLGDVAAPGDGLSVSEASRRQSALQLVSDMRGGKTFSLKAIKRAHDILGLPVPLTGDTPEELLVLEEQELGAELAMKRSQARTLIDDWKAGKSNASLKAVRRAYTLLDRPFDDERLLVVESKPA